MQHKDYDKFERIEQHINDYHENSGATPTIYEISKEMKMSPSSVSRYLNDMERDGYIERFGRRKLITRQMRNTDDDLVSVSVLGDIACGMPIFADGNIQEYVKLPCSLFGKGSHYILTCKGDSMIDIGIGDGDLVLVKHQDHAEEGQVVVALIDDEATLKRYYPQPQEHRIRLHPENSSMEDIYTDSCIIQGIAVRVIKTIV